MKKSLVLSALCIGALTATVSFAATAPAGAPAGSTGVCKDGSYYSGAVKKGACRGHQGVKDWWGGTVDGGGAPAAAPAAAPAVTTAAPAPAPAPAMPAPAARPAPAAMPMPAAQAAPGGGPGQVWVNSSTKVYHCSTDKWYGKTKSGSYMTEADAKAKGNHADHGKPCS